MARRRRALPGLALANLLCLTVVACVRGPGHVAGRPAPVECAPFARALTGVSLSGAAADWWALADGRFPRSRQPTVGSLLVFRRSGRLPDGHVAVVSRVLSPRRIMVIQANWVHHRVTQDQPVVDTSRRGDWSMVRVWWPPSGRMGLGVFPTFGFIQPRQPMGHDQLVASTPAAIQTAERGW